MWALFIGITTGSNNSSQLIYQRYLSQITISLTSLVHYLHSCLLNGKLQSKHTELTSQVQQLVTFHSHGSFLVF